MLDVSVPNTRKKRLLKLAGISKRLIKDYGFKPFLRIAFSELNKQKMGLFRPKISTKNYFKLPKQDLSEFDNYKIWLAKNLDIYNSKKLEQSNFSFLPSISFVVLIQKNSILENIQDSILSIMQQPYDKLNIVIYFENVPDIILNDAYIADLKTKPYVTMVEKNKIDSLNDTLSSNTDDFVAFLTAGDVLSKNAIYHIVKFLNETKETDLLYTDEDKIRKNGSRTFPFFKPDWSPHLFLSMDYISGFFLIRRKTLVASGGLRGDFGENVLYDLVLRITETTKNIFHLPLPLCSVSENKTKHGNDTAITAIKDALNRRNIVGHVEKGLFPNTFRIKYKVRNEPKVSIIIPTKDQKPILKRCINSLKKKTDYKNLEIIIIDNNSEKKETLEYLNSLPYQVIKFKESFNFSKMNNLAVNNSSGDYLLFLNDDVAALESNWLQEMISICQQSDVGAVSAKLVLSNNTIQHAGMAFLKTGSGFHPLQRRYSHDMGYFGFSNVIRDCSAVTGACLLIKRKLFEQVGGFDEGFDLYYGDSDLCLKIIKAGFQIVYTPYAVLLHEGSTKIKEHSDAFFAVENHYRFFKKWPELKNGDPYYSPNLGWDYQIDIKN